MGGNCPGGEFDGWELSGGNCPVWHINGNNDNTKNENVGNNSSTIIYFLVKNNQNFIKFKFFLTILRHDFNSVQSF